MQQPERMLTVAELDKSKPYFDVHGGANGAVFEQDGKMFDGDGKEVSVSAKGSRGKSSKAAESANETADEAATGGTETAAVDEQIAAQGAA